ncbi:hypothetical protein LguiA_012498 [Lonicera macranthoides]
MSQIAQRIKNNLLEEEELSWDEPLLNEVCLSKQQEEFSEFLSGLNITNPNSIYIKGNFYFKGYKKYGLDMYIDTGASMCTANKYVIPEAFWVSAKTPIRAKTVNDQIMIMDKVAEQIQVQISGITVVIPTLYQVDTEGDITLGNNFCRLYEPFAQYKDTVTFHFNGVAVSIKKVLKAHFHGSIGFLDSKKVGSTLPTPTPENVVPCKDGKLVFEGGENTILDTFNSLQTINDLLAQACSEHPLDNRINKGRFEAHIELIDTTKIVKVKPMQYSPADRAEFKVQINELLEMKLIVKSKSPHFSPAFLVRNHSEEKRNKARMVINYKTLNKFTKGEGYLLPNKDQLLQRIGGKKFFTSFDCKSGFWQVRLSKPSQELTAFTCPQGHYEWLVMPFGIKQAPSIFQRHMNETFEQYDKFCLVYVDDILVFSDTEKEHFEHVETILRQCLETGIVLSQKKAQVCKKRINFLGLEIDEGRLVLQEHIAAHLKLFPDNLQDRKILERFLGTLNYISSYFPKIAHLRIPLQSKLKQEIKWTWTPSDSEVVRKIKKQVIDLPQLYNPGPEDYLIIETDASELAWGGVLKAKRPNEEGEYLCRYSSGTFKAAEKNYHSNEKEILALIRTIKAFKAYLLPTIFTARTDNINVSYFLRTEIRGDYKQARLVRWQQWLQYYNFDIEHIKGTNNTLADVMSRDFAGHG